MSRLVVVGDTVLDRDVEGRVERLCPDAPVPVLDETSRGARPGAAALAAALLAADGHEVSLVTALAGDAAGVELRERLARLGVEVLDLGLAGATPEKVRLRADGRTLLRLDRHCAERARVGTPGRAVAAALRGAAAVLVADYGRGLSAQPALRRLLGRTVARAPLVWDPHPRGRPPVAGAALVTPNRGEARTLAPEVGGEGASADLERARALRARWDARALCVTLGARGALLVDAADAAISLPAPAVRGGDACGAGDRFASAVAAALATGAGPREAVEEAVAEASAYVAAGGPAALSAAPDGAGPGAAPLAEHSAEALAARVRAAGGTVVATGGCFDLLHPGHVRTLRAARALGDCLIVCINSDASVRRLKGPERPLVAAEDRAAVLEALECVDAVTVFDEPTPQAAIERLRPHVWAKGGDYAGAELAEAATVRRLGGEVVILPYLEGRSTTRLIEEATGRAG